MLDKKQLDNIKNFVLKNIVAYCDRCGTAYRPEDLSVLYDNTNLLLIQATCHKCKAQYMIQLSADLKTAQKVPVILDTSPQDLRIFMSYPPLNADVVLKLHELLAKPISLKNFFKKLESATPF